MVKTTCLVICFSCCFSGAIAQGNIANADSAWFENYFTRMLDKRENNKPGYHDSLEIIYRLAKEKKFYPAISRYHIERATQFISLQQEDSSLFHMNEAIRVAETYELSKEKGNAYLTLANYYQYHSKTLEAARLYLKASALLKEQGRRRTLIGLYWNLYTILNRLQQKNAALESILSAVRTDTKTEKGLVTLINESSSEEVGFNFPDQTLVKEVGTNGIWVIFGGARFPITTAEELGTYGAIRDVQRIPPGSLAHIPLFPRNGSMVRELDDGTVYVTKDDTLYSMGSLEAMETYGGWDGVYFLPANSLDKFPKSDRLKVTVDNRYTFFNYDQNFEILTDSITTALKKNEELSGQLSRQLAARNNALQKRRVLLYVSGIGLLALLIIVFLLVRNFRQKQKLHQQSLLVLKAEEELQRKMAIEKERTRIATDMHDDLGAGLSRIKFLSETIGLKKQQQQPVEEDITRIREYSHEMIGKMGEIVWALNEKNDSLSDLLSYTRAYAVEYLSQNGINCKVTLPENLQEQHVNGEFRRNIYLSVKEALHNIVKHSQARNVSIIMDTGREVTISIQDDGIGFNGQPKPFSNGLKNMEQRMKDINGSFEISNGQGTLVRMSAPVDS